MLRIAINGFGRIGRSLLRAFFENESKHNFNIAAINEIASIQTMGHLTRYDSTHGKFNGSIEVFKNFLSISGSKIKVFHNKSLNNLPWADQNIDVVIESSGSFSKREQAESHIISGAKKVLFSQPADKNVDKTIVFGVNQDLLDSSDVIISGASCTTNCVVPVIKIINDQLGIESGAITTIHSAMNDQPVIDAYHHTDLRKTRAAMHSVIPVDTDLALGIDRVMPNLKGKFQAQAMRVPTINVSAIDLSVLTSTDTTVEHVNSILLSASLEDYVGILGYTDEPLASCDFVHDSRSGIVDSCQTRVSGKRLLKILIWFDNEWGYANRLLDIIDCWQNKC